MHVETLLFLYLVRVLSVLYSSLSLLYPLFISLLFLHVLSPSMSMCDSRHIAMKTNHNFLSFLEAPSICETL